MGTGVSIVLIAVGAVLAWAVSATTSGLNVHAVGYILLVVGIVGLIISMMFWSSWGGPGYFSRRRTVYDGGPAAAPPASGRRTVVEEEETY